MAPESENNLRLEIGHVLFIDIVGYSKLLIEEQKERLHQLTEMVLAATPVRESTDEHLVRLPTGDGMALVFRHSVEDPARCALEIAEALQKHPELPLRMGIHSGPVSEVSDVSGRTNIAGAGINMAQRVMDCGDAGYILVSQHVADDLGQYRQWAPRLRELGECEVKHGVRLRLTNLYTPEAGNPAIPGRFKSLEKNGERKPVALHSLGIIVGVLSLAGLALVFLYSKQTPTRLTAAIGTATPAARNRAPDKSIAVLPFENLSAEKENAYFVEGIQDEILTRLSKVSALKVISRTSTMRYSSRPENLREIAQQLGVAHILEGSVQKAGGAVHVNVQLIAAQDDSHLWGESYDRDLKNIFAVEGEVAQAVADALKAQLLPQETSRVANVPTKNTDAHDLFLKAEYFANQIYSTRTKDPAGTARQAASLYEGAIAADPSFALAYARLSYLKGRIYWYNFDPRPETIAAAEKAARRALELQPELGEGHWALGTVYYYSHRDYDRALAEFEIARRSLPNNTIVLASTAFVHRRQGHMEQARVELEQAGALDPRDNDVVREIAITHLFVRQYAEAIAVFTHTLASFPDDLEAQTSQVAAWEMSGNLEAAEKALAEMPPDADVGGTVSSLRWQLALAQHQPDQALAVLDRAPPWLLDFNASSLPVSLLRGQTLTWKGEAGPARAAFLEAQKTLEAELGNERVKADAEGCLALVYAGLGDKDAALQAGRRAITDVPISQDVIIGSAYLAQLALVEAQVGEKDAALSHLEQLLSLPVGHVLSVASLRLDPRWDSIRDEKRFKELLGQHGDER